MRFSPVLCSPRVCADSKQLSHGFRRIYATRKNSSHRVQLPLPGSRTHFRKMDLNSYRKTQTCQEILKACDFSDWNPFHCLDVAEMTAGVSIGYDWFTSELTDTERGLISDAIIEKGLKASYPSTDHNMWWVSTHNNWNQFCHAGC